MSEGYVAILLDETGSMAGQEKRVVTGINEYINKLRNQLHDVPCRVALSLFDSERWREFFRGPLRSFPRMRTRDFRPGAMTPLYDAIAKTISATEAEADGSMVLVIIDTDGMENASQEVARKAIFKRIKEKESEGWTFVFLGADMSAFGGAYEAQRSMGLGLSPGNVRDSTHAARSEIYTDAAAATTSLFSERSKTSDETFWKRAKSTDKNVH